MVQICDLEAQGGGVVEGSAERSTGWHLTGTMVIAKGASPNGGFWGALPLGFLVAVTFDWGSRALIALR